MGVTLYHYASRDDYSCIRNLGIVWTSEGVAGSGVYLTDMPPECGPTNIVRLLHGDQPDRRDSADVCLETSSDELRLARKLSAGPSHGVWVCPTQVTFAAFKWVHFARDGALWEKLPVRREMRTDPAAVSDSKSPVAQLKELVVRQGIEPRYSFSRDGEAFVCTATCDSRKAEGAGSSKKDAQNKAAKMIIRSMLCRNKDEH